MWKHGNRIIELEKGWIDDNGVRHPSNWEIWSSKEKEERGITEITEDTPPDSKLYDWTMDNNGKITSTPKDLDDLKIKMKKQVKTEQGYLLSQTDWVYIRHYDTGIDVPDNIETWRNAIRAKVIEMEKAIDDCSNIEDVAKIWTVYDTDSKILGTLYDWPKLEE
tara:strand:- start:73 stop:564 length:492 start_codon:yes stop_codon:yes gene_type:complete